MTADMKTLAMVCLYLLPAVAVADGLTVRPVDFWNVELECEAAPSAGKSLTARTTITQPQGFTREVKSDVEAKDGKLRWRVLYPLLDEGRFDVERGNWTGYWIMGVYQFRCELLDGDKVVHRATGTFDPMSLCQRDTYGPIFTKYPRQFIECAPTRPAFIDSGLMSFTIRTIAERVASCTAVVDVTAANGEEVLAGPWTMELTSEAFRQEFETQTWPRGEYWIRVQIVREGEPIGPYLIRKVWKEILPDRQRVAEPLRIGRQYQMVTGPAGMAAVSGVRFVPDGLRKEPNGPLFVMDKPWETELLYYKTLHRDEERNEYVLEYELAGGAKEREAERAHLPSTMCQAVSKDGLVWTKPSLGLVEYKGSKENNLVPPEQVYVPPRAEGTAASLTHDLEKAAFRAYDAERDGPVNMQNVFVSSVKEAFTTLCADASSHPYRVGAWPMEKRGNEYLVLSPEAILYLGVGMDLLHTTEKITLHVEDQATGTLYYFFRPGAPSYPPHDAPYDNMHMTRRCLGVMWSRDGVNWERRLIAVPDEKDVDGAQFYYNTVYTSEPGNGASRPAMALEKHWNSVFIGTGQSVFGSFTVFDAKGNRLWPELVAVDDLLHWRRFETREKWIPNGPPGSYDHGLIKIEATFHPFGDEWWFPYQAINTLHQDYIGLARFDFADEFKQAFPNYAEMPGFVDWDQYFERCKTMRYYTGMARCRTGRVVHAESTQGDGELQTVPIVLEGDALVVNAASQPSGSLRVEVLDETGSVIPGFEKDACQPIQGDSTDFEVAWKGGDLSSLDGTVVSLRFFLDRAQLYGYRLQ